MPVADRYYLLLLLIVLLGTFGAVFIVLLLGAWRRHILRQRRMDRQRVAPDDDNVDIWRTSAERVAPVDEDDDE